MSGAINDGGNAFPCDPFIASRPGTEAVAKRMAEGMSLRDYLAAKALQALLGNCSGDFGVSHAAANMNVSLAAYALADAMIRARDGGAA